MGRGGGLALEIESFVGPCEIARADRRVLFGAHFKTPGLYCFPRLAFKICIFQPKNQSNGTKNYFSPGSFTSETEIDKSFLLACSLNEGKNIALYWQIQYCISSRDPTLREKHMDGTGQVFIGLSERTIAI